MFESLFIKSFQDKEKCKECYLPKRIIEHRE